MKQIAAILFGLAVLVTVLGARHLPVAGPDAGASAAPETGPAVSAAQPAAPAGLAGDAIRIDRDASGQFHLELAVNGTPTRFLVDTGADVVALTQDDAQRAGIPVNPADFAPILQTAAGQGWGVRIHLDRIAIGQAELRDVEAVVARDLPVSLLGQSVLRRLGRVEIQGDQIVLEPNT